MSYLANKTILIISPQAWGPMFISKHHYALELAMRGNEVYFLNPPDEQRKKKGAPIAIEPLEVHEKLHLITHQLWFPFILKFHALPVFHFLIRFHIKNILKKIGKPVDIVWSLDIGNLHPLRFFGEKPFKIFHAMDEPSARPAIEAAQKADMIFAVTKEILQKYAPFKAPRHLVNHGVANEFLAPVLHENVHDPIRVGISGNLLRDDLDRKILLQIIKENPALIFECWGSYSINQANVGGIEDEETKNFIRHLSGQPNVILHGVVPTAVLAKELRRMDVFLICYDVKKDPSKGTNYHKVLEFLSTGKIVVSNNVSAYKDFPHLVQMVADTDSNKNLPGLFRSVISKLSLFNSPENHIKRLEYVRENSYKNQLNRIEYIIENAVGDKIDLLSRSTKN